MAKLLTSWELGPLFPSAAYMSGGEVEAGFRLMQIDTVWGYLSMFRVFWARTAPNSVGAWLTWTAIYAGMALTVTYLGNQGKITVMPFMAGFLPLLIPVVKCIQQTISQYNWAIRYCSNVVNAGKQGIDWIPEHEMIEFVRTHSIKCLAEFKTEQQKLIAVKAKQSKSD